MTSVAECNGHTETRTRGGKCCHIASLDLSCASRLCSNSQANGCPLERDALWRQGIDAVKDPKHHDSRML